MPAGSPVKKPEDLAGVPIAVGYQSGSHYSTIQALEPYMPADKINLTFADGMLFHRLDQLIDGKAQASALFSGPYYFAEQLGFRKIIDTTFMIATMVTGDPDPEDLRKFFGALRRAQRDIDLRPDLYTHYYKNEFPERYHATMDTRRWGPGERLVFEPYTKEVYEETFKWIADHGIFADSGMGSGSLRGRGHPRGVAPVAAAACHPGIGDRRCPAPCPQGDRRLCRPRARARSQPPPCPTGPQPLVGCRPSASLIQPQLQLTALGRNLPRTRQTRAPPTFDGLIATVFRIRRHGTLSQVRSAGAA